MLRRLTWAKRLLSAPVVRRINRIAEQYRAKEPIEGDDKNFLRVLLRRREMILAEVKKNRA